MFCKKCCSGFLTIIFENVVLRFQWHLLFRLNEYNWRYSEWLWFLFRMILTMASRWWLQSMLGTITAADDHSRPTVGTPSSGQMIGGVLASNWVRSIPVSNLIVKKLVIFSITIFVYCVFIWLKHLGQLYKHSSPPTFLGSISTFFRCLMLCC